jgi:hypothetical protein
MMMVATGSPIVIVYRGLSCGVVTMPVRLSGTDVSSDEGGGVILTRFSCVFGLLLHEIAWNRDCGMWGACVSVWGQRFEWERRGGGHSPLSHPSPAFPAPSAALPCLTPPLLTSLFLLPPTTRGVLMSVEPLKHFEGTLQR